MKNKEKMRKIKRETQKERNWICWYSVYGKRRDSSQLWHACGWYLVYDGTMQMVVELQWNFVAVTHAKMVYSSQYWATMGIW